MVSWSMLIAMIIVAMIVIVYIWFKSRKFREIDPETVLDLSTADVPLLENWYTANVTLPINPGLIRSEVAKKFLDSQQLEHTDLLVLGTDVATEYTRLTGKTAKTINLRSIIGRPGEIVMVDTINEQYELEKRNTYDPLELDTIVDLKVPTIVSPYLKQVLKIRSEKLTELADDNLERIDESFAYLGTNTLPNTKLGPNNRINLLCTNLEFETLLKRWPSRKVAVR